MRRLNLGRQGLERLFGPLQMAVLEAIWARGPSSIRQVFEALPEESRPGFNSVMTVMNRLVAQRVLRRTGRRGRYLYHPVGDRQDLERRLSREVFGGLLHDFGAPVLAEFVGAAREADPRYLAELDRMLAELRGEEAKPDDPDER